LELGKAVLLQIQVGLEMSGRRQALGNVREPFAFLRDAQKSMAFNLSKYSSMEFCLQDFKGTVGLVWS
jgi:hypothetical protein